ncbi:hypothetical protein TrLO_g6188 [Triparma laevis f. longispina]|uniref:Uncharacterized protein n=1 Tax=Triparma laevis f. longispina TaxID=1714387 RepID=A0A9W7FU08_9STRA|nr:hypothetical protein TrLO_g6188 [Triparma laevis f. longispina]
MNFASSIKDLCQTYGIESSSYVYDKFGNPVHLVDPLFAFGEGTDERILVKLRFGPPKSYLRAIAKEKEGMNKMGAEWIGLRDLNRVTFEFEDPLMLTLVCKALSEKFKVSGLKNKFEDIYTKTYVQPPDIHINVDLGDGWLVEVQLMFSSVLTIKKELHKFYDIVRAKEQVTILSPVFDEAITIEKIKDEEIQNLKKTLESVKNADQMNQRRESWVGRDGGG